MSAFTRSYWKRVNAQAAQYRPQMRGAIGRAISTLRDSLTDSQVTELMANGVLSQLVTQVFDSAAVDKAFKAVDAQMQQVVRRGLETTVRTALPNAGKIDGIVQVHFDATSTRVTDAVRTLNTEVIQPFKDDVRQGFQQTLTRGLQQELSPREMRAALRTSVGLSPAQSDRVADFRGLLEAGDRAALSRSLGDPRLQSTLERAFANGKNLTEQQKDLMVRAYAEQTVARNIDVVSRTASLDAHKAGQNLAWQEAVDSGVIDAESLKKRWVTVGDDRVRDEHAEMEGETVPFDEEYSNGEMVPGESTFNCRCVSYVFVDRVA